MTAVARFLIRRWPALVGFLLLVAVLAASRVARLEFDFAFRHFFLDQAEDELASEMRARFGGNAGSHLVAVLQGPDVFDREVLGAITEASDAVAMIPHVQQVFSLATVPFIRGEGQALWLTPVAELAADGFELARLRVEVLSSPLYVRRLVSPDGRKTLVLALLDPEHRSIADRAPTIAAFRAAVLKHVPPGFTVLFTGYPITEAEYGRAVLRGFTSAQVMALVLMALTLYATFRTVAAVVLPLLTVGLATTIVMAMVELTGQRLTFTNAGVPLMMLVIGVSEVSFFVARFYEEAAGGWDPELPVRAVASTLWPGFIAAATTSAGFLALSSGHIGITRDFGFNMSIASLVTFAVAATLIPGALARLGPPSDRALQTVQAGVVTRAIGAAANAALERPWLTIVATVAFVALGVVGASRVVFNQYATRELVGEHEIFAAQRVVDTELSGAFQTHVVVADHAGGTVTTPERLRDIEMLQAFLTSQPEVLKSWSVVDYLKELASALGGPAGGGHIPDSPELIAQYLFLLSSGPKTSDVPSLIDPRGRFASIVLGTTDLGTDAIRALRRRADVFVGDHLAGAFDLRFVGDYWEISRGTDVLAQDQLVLALSSFALILPLVGLLLRSLTLTLLCLPPNIVPMAALGFMGFAGFPLRTGTSILVPVSIGIAVDMTTHYLARAREEWERDGNYAHAVRRAVAGTGWGMSSSMIALVIGFSSYLVIPFQSFRDIGILAAWTLSVALVTNLLFTPVLVLVARPFGERAADEAPRGLGRERVV